MGKPANREKTTRGFFVFASFRASHRGDIEARMGKPRKSHILRMGKPLIDSRKIENISCGVIRRFFFLRFWSDFGKILELDLGSVVWGMVAGSSAVVEKDW